jgi:hypothetical protein
MFDTIHFIGAALSWSAVALVVCALAAWLVCTWYFADDTPLLAPNQAGRVTFKAVLKNALHDLSELTRPIWLRVWLNAPTFAVIAVDAVSLLQEELRAALFGNFWGGLALVLLNLVARYGATPAHAPIAPVR